MCEFIDLKKQDVLNGASSNFQSTYFSSFCNNIFINENSNRILVNWKVWKKKSLKLLFFLRKKCVVCIIQKFWNRAWVEGDLNELCSVNILNLWLARYHSKSSIVYWICNLCWHPSCQWISTVSYNLCTTLKTWRIISERKLLSVLWECKLTWQLAHIPAKYLRCKVIELDLQGCGGSWHRWEMGKVRVELGQHNFPCLLK